MRILTLTVTFFIALSTGLYPVQALADLCCETGVEVVMEDHCAQMGMDHQTEDSSEKKSESAHASCVSACCHFSALAPVMGEDALEEGRPIAKGYSWINQALNNLPISVFRPPILS